MKEKNKKSLDQAIQQLKTHEPPRRLWDSIEWSLEKEQSAEQLKESIDGMPVYEAPDAIWDQIEAQIEPAVDQSVEVKPKSKILQISWQRIAAAAMLAGLTFFSVQWLMSGEQEVVNYSYSKETVEEHLLIVESDKNDEIYVMVMAYCNTEQNFNKQPELQNLKEELDELDLAKEVLMVAMQNYGKDAEIVSQLNELESERSTVLKKMVTKI